MSRSYDIVIVGAGMVGATLASALRQSDFRVLLLDRAEPPSFPTADYQLRVSAVNVAAQNMFERLGAFANMSEHRVSPMRSMVVWDEAGDGETRFHAADVGASHLGHIIENDVVTRALIDQVINADNVDTLWPAEVDSLEYSRDRITVTLKSGDTIESQLVVGADGARSRVRELAGIEVSIHNYGQRTLVAIARTEESHQDCAWQRFLETGPLALLPLAGDRVSIAWHADDSFAESLRELSPRELEEAISKRLGNRLGAVHLEGTPGGFPLIRMHAPRYYGDRVVLVGDAAHAVHPLAGLGANIGFMDAATLTEVLTSNPTRDAGDPRSLRAYDRARRAQNTATVGVTDAFKHVFGSGKSCRSADSGKTCGDTLRHGSRG